MPMCNATDDETRTFKESFTQSHLLLCLAFNLLIHCAYAGTHLFELRLLEGGKKKELGHIQMCNDIQIIYISKRLK